MNKLSYQLALEEGTSQKIFCLSTDLDISLIDASYFSNRSKRLVGEVFASIINMEEFDPETYFLCDGRIITKDSHPELSQGLLDTYRLSRDPEGTVRIPNLLNNQLFIRCAGDKFPLGQINYDTFKEHYHIRLGYDGTSTQLITFGSTRAGVSSGTVQSLSGKVSPGNLVSSTNETAPRNVVLRYFIKVK